jgi:hypothetical protein
MGDTLTVQGVLNGLTADLVMVPETLWTNLADNETLSIPVLVHEIAQAPRNLAVRPSESSSYTSYRSSYEAIFSLMRVLLLQVPFCAAI